MLFQWIKKRCTIHSLVVQAVVLLFILNTGFLSHLINVFMSDTHFWLLDGCFYSEDPTPLNENIAETTSILLFHQHTVLPDFPISQSLVQSWLTFHFHTPLHHCKFQVVIVMNGCESWTIKKAECRRIDAFKQIQCMKLKTLWLGTIKRCSTWNYQQTCRWVNWYYLNKEGKRRKKKNRSLGCRIVSSSLACVQSESQKEETVDEEEKVFEEIL